MIAEQPILSRIEYLEGKLSELFEAQRALDSRKLYLKATLEHLRSTYAAYQKELSFLRRQHKTAKSLKLLK